MTDPALVPPLLVTCDAGLHAALDRLAAAAGARTEVVSGTVAALGRWRDAPLVLVGADLVGALALERPPRRAGVHVVGNGPGAADLFRDALAVGAESVVELPEGDAWLLQVLADSSDGAGRYARVLGVVGGSGGVGASTLAVAVAMTAATARRSPRSSGGPDPAHHVTLVDADPIGGGLDRVIGLEDAQGTHWSRLAETTGRLGAGALRRALPRAHGVAVLVWGPGRRTEVEPSVVRETLNAASRASDLVVADLARYPLPMTRELAARCDDLVVVSGSSVHATAACARVLDTYASAARTHLVVRAAGAALAAEDVAEVLGLPLCAVLGSQRGLDEMVGLGLGPVRSRRSPLARAAGAVLAAVAGVTPARRTRR